MSIQFAGCDEQQSGQRFLESSAPRLIRHVTSCDAAGGDWSTLEWNTYPPPAGKEQKLSQGFGGSAPDETRVSRVLSSLDYLSNNRNTEPESRFFVLPPGRGKFCGRWSIQGTDPKTGRQVTRRVHCNSWSCSFCGPRKARTARVSIRNVAERLGLRYFLTLTLDPGKLIEEYGCDPETARQCAIPHMRKCFDKFRLYLKRKFGAAPSFIAVVELTKSGVPHLHILLDRYIEQKWISRTWERLGGGKIVFIKRVTVRNVARYLSKYLTKELLLSAPKGVRRITTSRSIKLFPRFKSDIAWKLMRESIWTRLRRWCVRASDFCVHGSYAVDAEQKTIRLDAARQTELFKYGLIHLEYDAESFLQTFAVDACLL